MLLGLLVVPDLLEVLDLLVVTDLQVAKVFKDLLALLEAVVILVQ